MRIIIKITELLQDESYKALTKEESDTLLSIVAIFAEADKKALPFEQIKANFDISEEFIKKTSFCLYYGKIVRIEKYFSWFKSNKTYVAKSRKKEVVKEETIIDNSVNEKSKKVDTIDYDRIKNSFNDAFKDTKLKNKLVKEISDERKKLIRQLYAKNGSKLNDINNIYDFYEVYWELIKDVGEKNHNHIRGWPFAANKDGWFHPTFNYYLEGKPFNQIKETMTEN